MIWTPLTGIIFLIAALSIPLAVYAATHAWSITRSSRRTGLEEQYALDKRYYLLSTVVGVIVVTRLIALGLYWVTLESLVPLIPGAMCIWGVLQAGAPFSWADTFVKLLVIYVYGIWLVLEYINRKAKNLPLMRSLSRGFLFLLPFLFIEAGMDLAFFWELSPILVPCCTVFFDLTSRYGFAIPCPFCFVFHEAPLMIGVIAGYGLSTASVVWGLVVNRYASTGSDLGVISRSVLRSLAKLSLYFALIATGFLIPALLQIILGGGAYH